MILHHDASPKKYQDAKIELVKQDWKEVKKQGVDSLFYFDYSLVETIESTEQVKSNEEGKFHINLRPKSEGEYKIRAIYTGSNGKEYVSSRYVYIESSSRMSWRSGNNALTELVVEKSVVKPGEKAIFTLQSPVKQGKYFISLEKDDGILSSFV